MILDRSVHREWLSNSYLVAAGGGGEALVVDAGAPSAPLIATAGRLGLRVTHVFDTHHHHDHVAENGAYVEAFGARVAAHPQEQGLIPHCTVALQDGERLGVGGLDVEVLHVPGHTQGQLNFLVGGTDCFTGDTLFAGSVGGTRAPGHGTYQQLRSSIMDRLMALPGETRLHPGHGEATTVEREWETNPFIRAWRGLDPEGRDACTAQGRPATLIVWARDYDGGAKAWVRFADGQADEIVPGSAVQRG